MKNYKEITAGYYPNLSKYAMWKGTPTQDIPESWGERIDIIKAHELSNNYNSGLVEIYKVKGKLKYSTYRDGCFWPYTGNLTKIQ
jgi:hypothetical protein